MFVYSIQKIYIWRHKTEIMRIHLELYKNKEIIPFNYQKKLTGCVHKWLGKNNKEHGEISFYSFSWFKNAEAVHNGLSLTPFSRLFISLNDETLAKSMVKGIMSSPEMFCGVRVKNVLMEQTPEFSHKEKFNVASPVLVKRSKENQTSYFTFEDEVADEYLTQTLAHKLQKANLDSTGVKVYFDKNYQNPKIKMIHYGNILNKTSVCPVIIEGTPEQISFAWNVGIGSSTGVGFGSIEK